MVDLVSGKQAVPYSGAAETFTVAENGLLRVKMWGGAGSGAYRSNATWAGASYGGAGGFTYAEILLKTGDVVRVETAGGGLQNTTSPGLGGWPDGGRGGSNTAAVFGGSGGGSSRIWVNDVLVAVAGGGGGGNSYYSASITGQGGAAGGLIGQNGPTGRYGTGGTQSAGGINAGRTTDAVSAGSYLQGGAGYRTGVTAETLDGSNSGAGGGGGYYGGGGSMSLNTSLSGGAGGGSSYLGVKALNSYTLSGDLLTPPATDDVDYSPGIAVGGPIVAAPAAPTPGGNGLVSLDWAPGETITQIAPGARVSESFSGSPTDYEVSADGTLQFELWGAGGSGAHYSAAQVEPGGAGGFTEGYIAVYTGDIVRVETAGPTTAITGLSAGLGGWPDGGDGGFYTTARKGGAGGGSTRVWINGVLVAVAGGGGGGGVGNSTNPPNPGGSGGGLEGGTPTKGTSPGGGGTQTAGGSASLPEKQGGYLQGGKGHDAASSPTTRNGTTGAPGSGGGGGYYGGGGGAALNSAGSTSAAGGGSGYLIESVTGTTTRSDTNIPEGTERSSYLPGVGVGSPGVNSTDGADATPSGPGLAVFVLTSGGAQIPANFDVAELPIIGLTAPTATAVGSKAATGTGTLPIVAVTAPVGAGVTPGSGGGDLGPSITIEPPTVSAAGGVGAILPTIQVIGDLGGRPATDALIVTDIVPYDLYLASIPEAEVGGAVSLSYALPTITIQPMNFILGAGFEFYDPIVFEVTAPEGMGWEAQTYEALIDSIITVESLDATGHGSAYYSPGPPGTLLDIITLSAPAADLKGDDVEVGADFGDPILLTTVEGEVFYPTFYEANPWIDLTVDPASGDGAGSAQVAITSPGAAYFARVLVQGGLFEATPEASSAIERPLPLVVLSQPQATFLQRADVRINAMPRVTVFPLAAIAFEGIGTAVDGDLSGALITVSAPEAEPMGGFALSVNLPVVYLQAPDGYVEPQVPTDGTNVVRLKRYMTSGGAPDALEPTEVAVNEPDGLLFLAQQGEVQAYPLADYGRGGLPPAEGLAGDVLGADGVWRQPAPVFDRPVRLEPPAAARVVLSEDVLGSDVATPQAGAVVYRPFFLSRQTTFARLGVTIDTPAAGSLTLGLCAWSLDDGAPAAVLASGTVSSASAGDVSVEAPATLAAGWYAAALAVSGDAPSLVVQTAATTYDAAWEPQGDPQAPYGGDLLAAPDTRAAGAHAYIWAEA